MNKILPVLIILILILSGTSYAKASNASPQITASHAISIDANSGVILYQKSPNVRAYPASITKLMTAILLMEHVNKSDYITLSHHCVMEPKSNAQVFFQHGEKLSRDTALFTMLTLSANDVACAIGEHIGGSEANFGKMMTAKAKALGATNTQFKNASGLQNPDHYTTAHDMALITKYAIQNKLILKAMNTRTYCLHTNMPLNNHRCVYRTNGAYDNPDSIGEKTGFTDQAKNTLVEVDQKNGKRIITVVLGVNNHVTKATNFEDVRKISTFAFSQLGNKQVVDKNTWTHSVPVLGKQIQANPESSLSIDINKGDTGAFTTVFVPYIKTDNLLYRKGIKKGEVVGIIQVRHNGKTVGRVNAVASTSYSFKRPTPPKHNDLNIYKYSFILLVLGLIALFFYIRRHRKAAQKSYLSND